MTTYTSNAQARRYMLDNLEDNRDRFTDEINTTYLAEDTCAALDLYEHDADRTIPEWLFELAYEVATADEQRAAD